jgi:integrase
VAQSTSKGRRRVVVPVAEVLAAVIERLPRVSTVMLTSSDKTPWTSDGFRTSFGRACAKAGIEGLTFHDLRGTAIT